MTVQHADDQSFQAHIAQPGVVLVDFHASWCGPCKAMAPTLDMLAATTPGVRVVKVDVDQAPETAIAHRVRSVPTLVLFKDGQVLKTKSGALSLAGLQDFVKAP